MIKTRSDALLVWMVNTAAAGGSAVVVTNSSNIFITNTNLTVTVLNSGGLASAVTISNSGGLFAMQSGPWTMAISNTSPLVQVQNSAGWIIAQSNTVNNINVINSAGWAVLAIDSDALGSIVTAITSTVGTVTLASANTNRVALSIYNASINPLFMKLGASASTASYTLMMVGSSFYELPRPIYSGIITGIWQSANGSALVSETT